MDSCALLGTIQMSRPTSTGFWSVDSNGRPSWWSWWNRLFVSNQKNPSNTHAIVYTLFYLESHDDNFEQAVCLKAVSVWMAKVFMIFLLCLDH